MSMGSCPSCGSVTGTPHALRCEFAHENARSAFVHSEDVDHPRHYGGESNPYEAIKVIEAWDLGFCLGNCIKYIARAGHKPIAAKTRRQALLQDLRKALWYLRREIDRLEKEDGD